MKRSLLIAAVAAGSLTLGVAGLVWAQQAPQTPQAPRGPGRMMGPPPGMMMGMMGPGRPGGPFGLLEFDANGDGKLTKAEFDAAQHARFNDMDANKDGFVVPEEMKAYREKVRAEAETARFQIMDTDHNGQISKSEYDAAQKNRAGHMGPPGGPMGGMHGGPQMRMRMRMGPDGPGGPGGPDGPGPRGPGRRGPGSPDGQQAQANTPRPAGPMDANRDGKLSFEEFSARAYEAFARADLNKDNIVTIAELQTLTKAMR